MFKRGQLAQIQNTDQLLVKLLSTKAKVPIRSSTMAAGYDLFSAEDGIVPAHNQHVVSTEISITFPSGCYGRIAPRSGLAAKNSIHIGAGVIDEDYCGPIKILLINHRNNPFEVKEGDRVAQLILEHIITPDTMIVDSLPETERGDKGFRSIGIS